MDTRDPVSTKMEQIATNTRNLPQVSFTSLAHHVDLEWLHEAYKSLDKSKAPGTDGQTAEDFATNLKGNLEQLLEDFKSGKYKAPPLRRVFIPKDKNEKRPIDMTTFTDKILQKAVTWILEPIYEVDFLDCSYGFRPYRSQHKAIKALWGELMNMGGAWIIDLDIRKYFNSIKWEHLCEILKLRVRDGVIIRTIGKWMNAGIMEGCNPVYYPEDGVPQGGIISPLLSNIYLHEILDKWFHEVVKPRLKGKAFEIRFADDAVLCFQNKEDAERVMKVLPKRMAKFGLELHPEKTKLINFKKPGNKDDSYKRGNRPGTFNFLGFKHYWKRSRKGKAVIARKTISDRQTKAIKKIYEWCRKVRHMKLKEQHKELIPKVRGHYNYYGINGNFECLARFLRMVERSWYKWLKRRSNRRNLYWDKFKKLLKHYKLPNPVIMHSNV